MWHFRLPSIKNLVWARKIYQIFSSRLAQQKLLKCLIWHIPIHQSLFTLTGQSCLHLCVVGQKNIGYISLLLFILIQINIAWVHTQNHGHTHAHTQTQTHLRLYRASVQRLVHQWVFTCLWMSGTMSPIRTETVDWSNVLQRLPFKWWCDYVSLYLMGGSFCNILFPEGFYVTEGGRRAATPPSC